MSRRRSTLASLAALAATPIASFAWAQRDFAIGDPIRFDPPAERIPRLVPEPAELAAVEIDPAVAALVTRLGDATFAEREAAAAELVARQTPPGQLVALLERVDLDAEQRFRVLAVLRLLLVDAPRGALGIRMDVRAVADPLDPGVEVTDLIPGMPAERRLRVNDRITHIEGRPLRSGDELVSIVQSRRPGDLVRLEVRRPRRGPDGELLRGADDRVRYDDMQFDVALGSVDDLGSPDRGPDLRGPVVEQRAIELQEVAVRYGPRAVRLPVAVADARLPFLPAASGPEIRLDSIDTHPVVVQLLVELARIREGRMRADAEFRTRWSREVQSLLDAAASREADAFLRERLLALADRLQELLRTASR